MLRNRRDMVVSCNHNAIDVTFMVRVGYELEVGHVVLDTSVLLL